MSKFALSSSDVYNQMRNSTKITSEIRKIDFREDVLQPEDINSFMNIIKQRINQPSKNDVLQMLNSGDFILINKDDIKIPNFINTISFKSGGRNKVLVNITNHMNSRGDIYPSTLYGLLQNAAIVNILSNSGQSLINNSEMIKNSSMLYSRLMVKVLDKVYALNLDKFKTDYLSYVFAKFFIVRVCGRPLDDRVEEIAYKSSTNMSSFRLIKDFENSMTEDETVTYQSIFNLFESLSTMDAFNKFKVRTFIEQYIKMYGESTVLAIDHLPSFYSMIFSAQVNAGLNKEYIIVNTLDDKTLARAFVGFFK